MTLKYDLIVRSIAFESQSIEAKQSQFIERLTDLPPPWGPSSQCTAPDPGRDLSAIINWARLFGTGNGIGGNILYQFRRKFEDKATYDDKIMLSFNPRAIDFRDLIDVALPRYIEAFDGYFAEVTNQDFLYIDFDAMRGIDRRHDFYRVQPISFMRVDFCDRVLKLTPRQIVERLSGKVAVARELLDGVMIVLTYDILPTEEMDRLCWKAKAELES